MKSLLCVLQNYFDYRYVFIEPKTQVMYQARNLVKFKHEPEKHGPNYSSVRTAQSLHLQAYYFTLASKFHAESTKQEIQKKEVII